MVAGGGRPGSGAPGSGAPGSGAPGTAAGQHRAAARILSWLAAHRTRLGELPEQVNSRGQPASVAPLAWTDTIVLLALVSQRHPMLVPPANPGR